MSQIEKDLNTLITAVAQIRAETIQFYKIIEKKRNSG